MQSSVKKIEDFQETLTGYCGTIGSDHSYVHQGKAFGLSYAFSLTGTATRYLVLTTAAAAANKYVHWRPSRLSTSVSGVIVTLHEAPTFTGGTAVTGTYNLNRNMSSTAAATTFKDTDISLSVAGTLLVTDYVGLGGNPSQVSGGSAGAEHEIVLKAATSYLITFTNITSTATACAANLFWYEEGRGQ